jgi:hypothetical protein
VLFPENEKEMARWLEGIICDAVHGMEESGLRITFFAAAGLLTADEGLVLRFLEGAEFQLAIVRSREGRSRQFSARTEGEGTRTPPPTCAPALVAKTCAH